MFFLKFPLLGPWASTVTLAEEKLLQWLLINVPKSSLNCLQKCVFFCSHSVVRVSFLNPKTLQCRDKCDHICSLFFRGAYFFCEFFKRCEEAQHDFNKSPLMRINVTGAHHQRLQHVVGLFHLWALG